MKSIIIFYHKNCPDGFGAAWAAWKKFKNKAEYIPVKPEDLPPKNLKNKEIYVLDKSYSIDVQLKLRKENKKVMILDHHASSEKNVRAFPENVFDNNHSGAVLAWKYFHPKVRVPTLLEYIEDGDLWKFILPFSHELTSYIYSFLFDFKIWDVLEKEFATQEVKKQAQEKGAILLQYQKALVKEISEKADLVRFKGYSTFAVNSSSKLLHSDIGHFLYEKKPPISIVWYISEEEIHVSLRSNGSVDVSKLAKKYGGGGHRGAAGFVLSGKTPFPWTMLKMNKKSSKIK